MFRRTTVLTGQAQPRTLALAASALAFLLLGTCVYILDRDWATAWFLAPLAGLQGEPAGLFGSVGFVLPAFCHAYAFSLLLILALGRTRRACLLGALAWFAVAAGLEFLQLAPMSARLQTLAAWYTDSPVLGSIMMYAVHGRFDPYDLAAAGLGCVAAWLIASRPEEGK